MEDRVPKSRRKEGSCEDEEPSSPEEPGGRLYQAQVPTPPSGIIYEGDLAIFKAKIADDEVWVINNNQYPAVLGSISDKEENELSQDQQDEAGSNHDLSQDQQEVERSPSTESRMKQCVEQIERVELKSKEKTNKRSVKREKKEKKKGQGREFPCDQCDYKATQKISLQRHLLVHAGQMFPCDVCEKSYRWELDLKRHRESAHSNLILPCPDCDYLGRSQRSLAAHKRSKHSGLRPHLTCQICGTQFSSSSYLQVHISSRHLGQREVCTECGHQFATKAILQRHLKEKHGGGKLKCEMCDETFTRKVSKERHQRKAHPEEIELKNEEVEKK